MIWLLLTTALAQQAPAWRIHRIAGAGAPTGLAVRTDAVIGADGGVGTAAASARYTHPVFTVGLDIPVAWYVTAGGVRGATVGNIGMDAAWVKRMGAVVHQVGAEARFAASRREVWVNRAEETWPGGGVRAVWEVRADVGATRILGRAALGVQTGTPGQPFPDAGIAAVFQAAFGVDQTVVGPFGLAAEVAGGFWDASPLDITVAARVAPVPGLHLRTGVVMPVGTWAGWAPSGRGAGVREATWWAGLSVYPPERAHEEDR